MRPTDANIAMLARLYIKRRFAWEEADHAIEIDDSTDLETLRSRATYAEEKLEQSWRQLVALVMERPPVPDDD